MFKSKKFWRLRNFLKDHENAAGAKVADKRSYPKFSNDNTKHD